MASDVVQLEEGHAQGLFGHSDCEVCRQVTQLSQRVHFDMLSDLYEAMYGKEMPAMAMSGRELWEALLHRIQDLDQVQFPRVEVRRW